MCLCIILASLKEGHYTCIYDLLNDKDGTTWLSILYFWLFFILWQGAAGLRGGIAGRAGRRRGRLDLLRWLGGRAGGHPVPRPRPVERPSGRGKHTQSTWPDLELDTDSRSQSQGLMLRQMYTCSTCWEQTHGHAHAHMQAYWKTDVCCCMNIHIIQAGVVHI